LLLHTDDSFITLLAPHSICNYAYVSFYTIPYKASRYYRGK